MFDAFNRADAVETKTDFMMLYDGETGAKFPTCYRRRNRKWVVQTVLPVKTGERPIPMFLLHPPELSTLSMPTINNLMTPNPAAGANPQPGTAVEPTNQQPAANNGVALSPAAQQAMSASPFAGAPRIAERPVGAYVASAHPNSGNWPTCQMAGIQEGDFYLDGATGFGGSPVKLSPFKYWLYAVSAFCTDMDSNGNVVRATDRAEVVESREMQEQQNLQQHFVTVVLVDLGDKIIPAKADFRHTKAGAVGAPAAAFRQLDDPAWPRQSDAHRVAAQFPHPFGRIYCQAWPVAKTVRAGKNAGKRYHAAQASASPTALNDMERLGKAFGDPSFTQALNQAMQTYAARCDQIRAAIK